MVIPVMAKVRSPSPERVPFLKPWDPFILMNVDEQQSHLSANIGANISATYSHVSANKCHFVAGLVNSESETISILVCESFESHIITYQGFRVPEVIGS